MNLAGLPPGAGGLIRYRYWIVPTVATLPNYERYLKRRKKTKQQAAAQAALPMEEIRNVTSQRWTNG